MAESSSFRRKDDIGMQDELPAAAIAQALHRCDHWDRQTLKSVEDIEIAPQLGGPCLRFKRFPGKNVAAVTKVGAVTCQYQRPGVLADDFIDGFVDFGHHRL